MKKIFALIFFLITNSVYAAIPPQITWSYQTGGPVDSEATFSPDGSTVYFTSYDGKLYAFDTNGHKKWEFQATPNLVAFMKPAVAADGTIYIGAGNNLYAVTPDGKAKWSNPFPTNDYISSSAALGKSLASGIPCTAIYFNSNDQHVYAIEDHGSFASPLWTTSINDFSIISTPLIDLNPDGTTKTVYIGGSDALYAINGKDGSIKWSDKTINVSYHGITLKTNADGSETLYVAGNRMWVFGEDGNEIFAIDPTGNQPKIKWRFFLSDDIKDDQSFSSPAIAADGTIYVATYKGHLYALNANGQQKWQFDSNLAFFASPTIAADGTIYIGTNISDYPDPSPNNRFFAINPDGTKKSEFQFSGTVNAVLIGLNQVLYIGTRDNMFYALKP